MSWQDRDKLDMKIITGDGIEYTVYWLVASIKTKWHGGDKSYIELPDSNVEKRKRQGRVLPLEFFFIGEDHLEDAAAFRSSLDSQNAITIQHPYYNTIICQILEFDVDNSQLNVSRCTCTALETMVGYSAIISNPRDLIQLKKIELDDLLADQPEISLNITEVNTLKDTTEKIHKLGTKIISVPDQAQDYFNAFSTASGYINTFTQNPIVAMQTLNTFLNMPAQFISKVDDRIRIMKEQFDILRGTVMGLFSPQSKLLFEAQTFSLLSAMCQAATLPFQDDYQNANVAANISLIISESYSNLLEDLDIIQTSNNGSPSSYVPSFEMYVKLQDTVFATNASLYDIALSGRKQRTYILPENSCVILLTHKLMRLDSADKNIQELIKNNNLTHRDIALGIEKGRTITYFI